ncbi:MAG: DMT family transporter [Acidobacteriota bacterium]|nr:DMT family transporter [Acidobacteriota bacterium]MDQ7087871.1 DMT family transporter [Acidobacteriota bacterium]
MLRGNILSDLLLLLAALIWGTAFVAQRAGMEVMGPLLFNGVRFGLGALVVLPLVLRRRSRSIPPGGRRGLLAAGVALGSVLFAGATLQQIGLVETTAGKAGFITGLYVVIVPLLGMVFGRRPRAGAAVGAALAAWGLYLLSVTGSWQIEPGDGVVLVAAFFWAGHVLLVGRFAGRYPGIPLAMIQFLVCSTFSLVGALLFEQPRWGHLAEGWVSLVWAGAFSVGVAYTLQVVAQRKARPSHAAVILSLEAVFAALAGWVFLDERLGTRGWIGCSLMLGGMFAAQYTAFSGMVAQSWRRRRSR